MFPKPLAELRLRAAVGEVFRSDIWNWKVPREVVKRQEADLGIGW